MNSQIEPCDAMMSACNNFFTGWEDFSLDLDSLSTTSDSKYVHHTLLLSVTPFVPSNTPQPPLKLSIRSWAASTLFRAATQQHQGNKIQCSTAYPRSGHMTCSVQWRFPLSVFSACFPPASFALSSGCPLSLSAAVVQHSYPFYPGIHLGW